MMTREEAIMWLIKPTITSTEISVSKAKELEAYDMAIEALSAEAVSEDTQTEERGRLVSKETELAHVEAKLENAEKRLQGAYTAAEAVLSDLEKWRTWSHTYDNMCKERLKEEYGLVGIPEPCKKCSNHPSNGGSGICHCTLGNVNIVRW